MIDKKDILLGACDLCNRRVLSDKLIWSDLSDRRLCLECLAEEESCSCADPG